MTGLQAVYGAITDNWPTVEPYFNETGSNCPSILPMKQQQELIELAVQAVQCLGFQMVSHRQLWAWTYCGLLLVRTEQIMTLSRHWILSTTGGCWMMWLEVAVPVLPDEECMASLVTLA